MGFSDSPNKALLSADKDSHHANGCNFLSRSSKEPQELCQIAPSNERVASRFDDRRGKEEAGASGQVLFASLKVKLPEVMVEEEGEDEEEVAEVVNGLSTPTSLDHKIPTLVCPPAPRKPKSVPSAAAATKRKGCRKRVFLDLTNEIESLFPAAIRADFGNKIKKVRKES